MMVNHVLTCLADDPDVDVDIYRKGAWEKRRGYLLHPHLLLEHLRVRGVRSVTVEPERENPIDIDAAAIDLWVAEALRHRAVHRVGPSEQRGGAAELPPADGGVVDVLLHRQPERSRGTWRRRGIKRIKRAPLEIPLKRAPSEIPLTGNPRSLWGLWENEPKRARQLEDERRGEAEEWRRRVRGG
eukprot:6148356-Pyramimonas_sp.AAC.1